MKMFVAILLCTVPVGGLAQEVGPLDLTGKLRFHGESVYSPLALVSSAAYAGILQGIDSPHEWGQGAGAYGKRTASTLGASAIHATLAFGFTSSLRQDPRYFRSRSPGFLPRVAHAFRGTVLTRTDRGGETLSAWRLGSAYGTAFLSNQWYPDRLNTIRRGASGGSFRLVFGFATNLASEFWPDLKRKFSRAENGGAGRRSNDVHGAGTASGAKENAAPSRR